jgi:hypothetical protein
MESHNFQWVNPLFLWPFPIANCNVYQRVDILPSLMVHLNLGYLPWLLWLYQRLDHGGVSYIKKSLAHFEFAFSSHFFVAKSEEHGCSKCILAILICAIGGWFWCASLNFQPNDDAWSKIWSLANGQGDNMFSVCWCQAIFMVMNCHHHLSPFLWISSGTSQF